MAWLTLLDLREKYLKKINQPSATFFFLLLHILEQPLGHAMEGQPHAGAKAISLGTHYNLPKVV